jgi:3-phosphoshikimate 1-carboxyvinyltransferase
MKVHGTVTVPGDKSLTHRLLLLASLAPGKSRLRAPLTSLDARSTARVLRTLGVEISPLRPGADVSIQGRARYRLPTSALSCGNSGTTARLLLGLLAGHPFLARLTGDKSLSQRPMRRVTEPLKRMGAWFQPETPDRLPFTIRGGRLAPIEWAMPVSSAQIKSCLLLAGVAGQVALAVREPTGRSRDHTERLLRAFGYRVEDADDGWIRFEPTGRLVPFDLAVPGDISSAAFLLGAALLAEAGSLCVRGVGLNPTRTGALRVLDRMGARVTTAPAGECCGEPVGDLLARPGPLLGTTIRAEEVPGLIDEIPMLAVLASRARGTTRFQEIGELRVKESDRVALLVENLRAVGARAEASGNTLVVEGVGGRGPGAGALPPPRGRVRTEGDHRIAMAFAVLGTIPGARVQVDNLRCAEVSFPGFAKMLRAVRAK